VPNGGSDNCGTCWFNTKNKGERGFKAFQKHRDEPDPAICRVRGFKIPSQLYTYCANHPMRNPDRIDVPLGPALQHCMTTGEPADVVHFGDRWLWQESPDTPVVRDALLRVLDAIAKTPWEEYPIGPTLAQLAIWQVAEFKESRAVPYLEAIIQREAWPQMGVFTQHFEHLAPLARRAIAKIRSDT